MGTRSIFDKVCPACAASVSRQAEHCGCGYVFLDEAEAHEQTAMEEELFLAYLSARVQQGLEALNAARAELSALPGDFNRASLVMQRVIELQTLRTELEAQQAKTRGPVPATNSGAEHPDGDEAGAEPIAFRAAQAARAEEIARQARTVLCPACQRPWIPAASNCECGYRRPPTPPALSPDAHARAKTKDSH